MTDPADRDRTLARVRTTTAVTGIGALLTGGALAGWLGHATAAAAADGGSTGTPTGTSTGTTDGLTTPDAPPVHQRHRLRPASGGLRRLLTPEVGRAEGPGGPVTFGPDPATPGRRR